VSESAPVYWTPREVAQLLRRSPKRLYALIAADATFPRVRLPGGGLLIPRVALERWLKDRTEGMRGPLRPATESGTCDAAQRTASAGALNGATT
jgi:hypothetical protein